MVHRLQSIITFCALTLMLVGCAHQPKKSEALVRENSAFIQSDGYSVGIPFIDGQSESRWMRVLLPLHRRTSTTLVPGEHTLTISYLGNSVYDFKLTAEAGHVYRIKDDVQNTVWSLVRQQELPLARIWIIDSASGREVGDVIASRGEPLSSTTTISLPPFFTWEPPQTSSGMVMSRSSTSRTIGWIEPTEGGPYTVTIRVEKLPDLRGANNFLEHAKNALQQEDSRSNTAASEVQIDTSGNRSDFCVKYYRAITQGAGGSPTGIRNAVDFPLAIGAAALADVLRPTTRIDTYGYYYRAPTNKAIGINFSYSHFSQSRQPDPHLNELAEKYFSRLKF